MCLSWRDACVSHTAYGLRYPGARIPRTVTYVTVLRFAPLRDGCYIYVAATHRRSVAILMLLLHIAASLLASLAVRHSHRTDLPPAPLARFPLS